MWAKGVSIRGIAEVLNEAGVPTAHGGARWHASTVQKVLGARVAADGEPLRGVHNERGAKRRAIWRAPAAPSIGASFLTMLDRCFGAVPWCWRSLRADSAPRPCSLGWSWSLGWIKRDPRSLPSPSASRGK